MPMGYIATGIERTFTLGANKLIRIVLVVVLSVNPKHKMPETTQHPNLGGKFVWGVNIHSLALKVPYSNVLLGFSMPFA